MVSVCVRKRAEKTLTKIWFALFKEHHVPPWDVQTLGENNIKEKEKKREKNEEETGKIKGMEKGMLP